MSELTFEEFAPPDLAAWLEKTRRDYIAERVAAGDSLEEASLNADRSFEQTFPGGSARPGQLAGLVSHEGVPVGELWIGPYADDVRRWWVWNIELHEERRGQGFGRRAMLLAEELARDNGAETIGLNVFAQNAVARGLYGSLGYEESSVQMRKELGSAALS